jgi:hypothetical protein
VNQDQLWIRALVALRGPGSTVHRTVVNDPEDTASIIVLWARHHLLDQAVKCFDTILAFAAAQDPGIVNIQTGDVGPGAAPKAFMLYLHRATGATGASGMFAPTGLKGSPSHMRAYRSRMRPALSAKLGSRGKIQLRWRQGRIAY